MGRERLRVGSGVGGDLMRVVADMPAAKPAESAGLTGLENGSGTIRSPSRIPACFEARGLSGRLLHCCSDGFRMMKGVADIFRLHHHA
jgi:hypothetical protein